MAELKSWDVAAANNNDAAPDGAPEGMAPSAVNDVIRENMAVLARHKGDNDGSLDSGGSSNVYTLTPNGTYSAIGRGDTFVFEANHTNTGSATLNVGSTGAQAIKHMTGAALIGGEIQSGGVYTVYFDGTDYLLENPSLQTTALAVDHPNDRVGVAGIQSPLAGLHVGTTARVDDFIFTRNAVSTFTSGQTISVTAPTIVEGSMYLAIASRHTGTANRAIAFGVIVFSGDGNSTYAQLQAGTGLSLTTSGATVSLENTTGTATIHLAILGLN